MNNIWAIILAAGKSERMKKQKLLLPFQGETIIEKVVKIASSTFNHRVVIVLGSHSDKIHSQISNPDLVYCINRKYEEGMLSSVISGLASLPDSAQAAMIFLGDQPQIPQWVPNLLIAARERSGKGIIIPTFSEKRGHPILIDIKYRSEIALLDPDKGLRGLMNKYTNDICETECGAPEIIRDIDTPADYYFEINKNR